jgi:hypothetical protein
MHRRHDGVDIGFWHLADAQSRQRMSAIEKRADIATRAHYVCLDPKTTGTFKVQLRFILRSSFYDGRLI